MRQLTKRAEFLNAARGRRASRHGIVLQAMRTSVQDTGIGYTVTKKSGNSPERNRIKRRLRAAVQACAGVFETQHNYVLIGRREVLTAPFSVLVSTIEGLIANVHSPKSQLRADHKTHAR